MQEKLKQAIALTMAFFIGYAPVTYASYRFTDDSNVRVGGIDNSGNADFDGTVTATSFSGSGSSLTGVTVDDGAITSAKLSADSVDTEKIVDNSVTSAHVNFNYAGSSSEGGAATSALALDADPSDCSANEFATAIAANGNLTCATLSDASVPNNITIDNLSGTNTGDQTITLTGDVTGSGTGSFSATIAGGSVSTAKLATDAVSEAKILNGAVTTNKILDGSVSEAKLDFDPATQAELDAVTPGHGDGSDCSAGNYPLGVDASGNAQSCTADDDSPDSDGEVPDNITVSGSVTSSADVTLKGGTAPTSEGNIQWNTSTDRILVGDGSTTQTFYSGAHTVDTTLSGSAAGGDLGGTYPNPTVNNDSHTHGDGTVSDTITVGSGGSVDDGALSANVTLLGSAISTSETDFIEEKTTTASLCTDSPSATAQLAISTDGYDLYMSTGTGIGQWRNTRTGAGPC